MTKRFIVLVDFSSYSRNLIRYACDWGKQAGASLILVHQTVVVAPGFIDSETKQNLTRRANDEALEKLRSLAGGLVPPSVETAFLASESHLESILTRLLSEPFDHLIFVGLKGTGLMKKIFLGSVALQVIENANSIVVAVPSEIDAFSHRKIFVAVKDVQFLNIPELNRILGFMDSKRISIVFFYLAGPSEKTEGVTNDLNDLAKLFGDRFETSFNIYEGENPFTDIEKVINNKIDEMLVVQKGSRLLTDQFFRRFLVNHLVYKGQTPLVVLP